MAIDRIERAIAKLDQTATSIYKKWNTRKDSLAKQIAKVTEEITLQQKAYNRYIQEADSVGLSDVYKTKVQNGTIDIETITDEELKEKIDEYQQWYEKALECDKAIDDLNETVSELYKTSFDNVATEYGDIISILTHNQDMLQEYINQSEKKGYITSVKYYEALKKQELENISQLQKEKTSMLTELNNAVASGKIQEGSEAWYDMCEQINEVTKSIEEANTSLLEYDNSIRQVQWDVFDLLQERIDNVTKESDFLINLMADDKLYEDNGQLTNEGKSTMGLHGVDYNVYMEQAKKYGEEIKKINKDIANDPYDTELIERKEKLIELQREAILSANKEKQAIKDMVEEGIKKELDALKDLIDKYNEAMDSQKDLYDYQKTLEEKTEAIASLQKQMSAYSGDTSEETKQKVQELKVSLKDAKEDLEQTQYDRYISDQKKMLDDMYNEYEEVLNQRLDNLEQLISDMITEINTDSSTIQTTLGEQADKIGYTLSGTMNSIWNSEDGTNKIVKTYGDGQQNTNTTVITALNSISVGVADMVKYYDAQASAKANEAQKSNTVSTPQASGSSSTSGSGSNSSNSNGNKSGNNNGSSSSGNSNGSSSNNGWGSWFVKKNDSYPKNKLDKEKSIVDRLKFNNFDSSYSARQKYYSAMGGSGTYTGSANQNIWMLNQMKQHGYKNGTYNLKKDELAWTQEGKKLEAIIRPSDGAILTPLARQDSVLNAKATDTLFNFANKPEDFINSLTATNSIPSISTISNQDNNVTFEVNLPNVQNYSEFKYALQHDKSFEKMVRSMTVDKMFGGSSLKKYNC